jgi:uncharacterized YccA/Bax inhibitor family protein
MTVDDVVVRSVGLLALTVVSGAAAWVIVPAAATYTAWIAAMLIGLVVGFVVTLSGSTNPALMMAYAVIEGVFVGMVSRAYENAYSGIVLQAALGTVGVFFGMLILYKSRVIRVTPRFNRILFGCMIGASFLVLGNLLLYFLGVNTILNGNGPIAFIFALGIVLLGALSFASDFDLVERGVAQGLPRKYAWTAAFGILVGIIVVYIWLVRLLGIVRSN